MKWGNVVNKKTNKSEQKRRGGGGQAYLYVYSVKKIAWFFKEFFLTRCLAFGKCFAALRLAQHKQVFFWQKGVVTFFSINDYDLCKIGDLLCWYYKKTNYFPAFHSRFSIWKFIIVEELFLRWGKEGGGGWWWGITH